MAGEVSRGKAPLTNFQKAGKGSEFWVAGRRVGPFNYSPQNTHKDGGLCKDKSAQSKYVGEQKNRRT